MFDAGDASLLDGAPGECGRETGQRETGQRETGQRESGLVADWDSLAEPVQLELAGAALRRAAATFAFQAETLACEMEGGGIEDRGGPEALRLLATLVRVTTEREPGATING